MEKSFNDKMLTNAALLFVLVIIGSMFIQWILAPSYSRTNKDVHEKILSKNVLILPWQLKQMANDGSINTFTAVDLSSEKLTKSELFKETIQIPLSQLLEKDQLIKLKKDEKILFFADDESKAMIAVHLLLAKGYQQVFAVANDASFFEKSVINDFKPKVAETHTEKARFDFGRFFSNESKGKAGVVANPQLPQGSTEIKAVAGGC
ncbi:MAG: hypothetical protein Q8J88_08880 [Bacteroidales bacterium]|nr:hypothetical protein [Bacteroidales bacterium]